MAMTSIAEAVKVQRSQVRGSTLTCVNCDQPLDGIHKPLCYEGTKAVRHVERHTIENPNCDYCTGRM